MGATICTSSALLKLLREFVGNDMKLALTQQAVEKIAPHTTITEYRDSRLKGFLLRVTPTGSK
jgi:hypothetical protein